MRSASSVPARGARARATPAVGKAAGASAVVAAPRTVSGVTAPRRDDSAAHPYADTPPDHAAHPARQRRKEARPQELLDAALELFVEKGFAATKAEEVAQRAGVSKGTLYLYYQSKEELFKAVVRQNLGALIEHGQEVVAQFQGPASELLVKLMLTWWERVIRTRAAGIHKVVLAEVRNFPELAQFYSDEVIVPADELFCAVIQRGIDAGEFRDLPLHETAHALMAPMIFMALHQHSVGACPVQGCGAMDPERMVHTHLDLALRGLQARADAPPPTGTACDR